MNTLPRGPTACGIIGSVVHPTFYGAGSVYRTRSSDVQERKPEHCEGDSPSGEWKWRPAAVVCLPQPATTRDDDGVFVQNSTRGRDSIRGIVMAHECDLFSN